MSGILLNILFATLAGSAILAIRKLWGQKLHPRVLKVFWAFFFICALLPMPSADRLWQAAVQQGGEKVDDVKYEWRDGWHFGGGHFGRFPPDCMYSTELMDNMDRYRLRRRLREAALAAWGAGCALSLLYRTAGAGMLRRKSRADCRYGLPPEKLRELGIPLSMPVQITGNAGPMVLGIKPAIYVPERFLSGEEGLLRSIVLHEREHVAQKHHLVLVLISLAGSVYWFLPYVERIFFRALREDMEYRCDYELIRSRAVEAGEYARHCIAVAQDRGRLCNELPFGEGGLKKRVRHMQQSGKKTGASLLAGAAMGMAAFACAAGIAHYYKRDVQGFTRWEVEDAKEAVVNFVDACNSRNPENVEPWVAEGSPAWYAGYRYAENRTRGEYAVYDITYQPDDWSYYYATKSEDGIATKARGGRDRSNCIYLVAHYMLEGELYDRWDFVLVRENKNSRWKLYADGM